MKNIEEINHLLIDLAERRMELARLTYANLEYDQLEEELHQAQDDFDIDYGEDFEKILKRIHAKYCPKTDIQKPIAYLAKKYIKLGKYEDGTPVYDVANYAQGVLIDHEEYDPANLVLIPNPVRVLFMAGPDRVKKEVWQLEEDKVL